jgi:hypothetical protein
MYLDKGESQLQEDDTEEVIGKIINHEMMESEAKYRKSLSKGTSTSRG